MWAVLKDRVATQIGKVHHLGKVQILHRNFNHTPLLGQPALVLGELVPLLLRLALLLLCFATRLLGVLFSLFRLALSGLSLCGGPPETE